MPIDGRYTVAEAARELGLDASTLRRAIAQGKLATTKVHPRLRLIAPDELRRYAAEHRGQHGWDKRKAEGYTPDAKASGYARAYRARKKEWDAAP